MNAQDYKAFITAGKAIFTVENPETGKRFTFKVVKKQLNNRPPMYFVSLLSGPDNTRDYTYIGTIFGENFQLTRNSRVTRDALSYKVFCWLWKRLTNDTPLDPVKLYHAGYCGRCGRRLTVPESIESGFGPECINKVILGG